MLVSVLFLLACGPPASAAPAPRAPRAVATRAGVVRGYPAPRPTHYAFLGLPYARPLHRFKAPEPPPKWDGIFEATHRVKCLQPSGEGDENCLVVNVFAPAHAASCCLMPVLVYVHDGGFQNGWGAFHPPSRLLLQDFVIVTFNYRLGALGFLCLGTPEAPGNAGLKDQVAALYWVKRNIASFGGNPHDITVYGIGSGAVSLQLLLLSGLMKGLVHRVILDSGSVLSPSAMAYDPYSSALKFAISLGYEDKGDITELERFYREIPVADMLNASMLFLPCVENNIYDSYRLLEQDPIEILNSGNFDTVPMLIMYTNAKEIMLVEENPERFQMLPESLDELLPNNLEFSTELMKHKISELVKEFYFIEDLFNDNVIQNYVDYINDIFMEYPVVKFAVLYALKGVFPVYLMKFSYNNGIRSNRRANYAAIHNYIFSNQDLEDNETISQKLIVLLSNFIKMGDPTPLTTSLMPMIWQPVTARQAFNETADVSKAAYLVFDKTLGMNEPRHTQAFVFWDHVYERFYKLHSFDGDAE